MEPETKKKIELKNDGKDFNRFNEMLRQVVSVPKEELKRREDAEKTEKKANKV